MSLIPWPAWRWGLVALIILAVSLLLWRVDPFARSAPAAATGPIVLVSGRDDHGLLAQPTLALTRGPGQTREVAHVPDATFVRVLSEQGEWLRVQAIGNPQQTGWINDYHLRNRALWMERGKQVSFVDARQAGNQVEVAIRPLGGSEPPTWVATAQLREVGAQEPQHAPDHHHTP